MESALLKITRNIMDCCIRVTVILLLATSADVSGENLATPLNECPVHVEGKWGSSARIADCPSGNPVSPFTEENAEENEVKDSVLPSLTPSLFSKVPPTINFVRPDQKVEELPQIIRDRLKYYASPSSPVAYYASLSGFTLTQDVWEYTIFYGLPYQINMARDYLSVLPHQKFNHIPDSWALGCKDQLGRNLQKFKAKYGEEDYGIFPETFVLPEDKVALKRAWNSSDKHRTWLLKPPCAFGGKGIEVVQDWKKVPKKEHTVVQRYISNPLLVNGSKVDLRVYVHVTSINPLRIYVNPEGLVRISVEKYTMKDIKNRAIHLTNKDINDNNSLYFLDEQLAKGNRRSLTWLWDHLKENYGVERQPIWDRIKDLVIKTVLSGEDTMQRSTQNFIRNRYSVHELFAFDIFLDGDMKPWVMEVNVSPRFTKNVLTRLIDPMLTSMLNLAGIQIPAVDMLPKLKHSPETVPKNLLMDRRLWTQQVTKEEKEKHQTYTTITDQTTLSTILDTLTPDDIRMLIETVDENNRRGQFERIFPAPGTKIYHRFFERPRYYNILLDQWVQRYHQNEEEGIQSLESYCREEKHLQP